MPSFPKGRIHFHCKIHQMYVCSLKAISPQLYIYAAGTKHVHPWARQKWVNKLFTVVKNGHSATKNKCHPNRLSRNLFYLKHFQPLHTYVSYWKRNTYTYTQHTHKQINAEHHFLIFFKAPCIIWYNKSEE